MLGVGDRRQDALSAFKSYNNVQLDGKPMKIEVVGTNTMTPAAGLHLQMVPLKVQVGFPKGMDCSGQRSGPLEGHMVVVVEAMDLEGAVDGEGAVLRRYLRKILILNWRSITKKQRIHIEFFPQVYWLASFHLL
ncbi:unnamed protein product [Ilex paraguariensis]|uniref:Uncharacterized protein n=1 Tax=Ilex paraguariensis TaxID=185542 RepID=A0ABC8T571_9AQUA